MNQCIHSVKSFEVNKADAIPPAMYFKCVFRASLALSLPLRIFESGRVSALHPHIYDEDQPRPSYTFHPNVQAYEAGRKEVKGQAEVCYDWIQMYADNARTVVKFE